MFGWDAGEGSGARGEGGASQGGVVRRPEANVAVVGDGGECACVSRES